MNAALQLHLRPRQEVHTWGGEVLSAKGSNAQLTRRKGLKILCGRMYGGRKMPLGIREMDSGEPPLYGDPRRLEPRSTRSAARSTSSRLGGLPAAQAIRGSLAAQREM